MDDKVYLRLVIDNVQIDGESTVSSHDRQDSIECFSFHSRTAFKRNGNSISTLIRNIYKGRGRFKPWSEPVIIRKRIDRSTPLLLKALYNSEPVNSAEFRFFRTTHGGGEEHYYTVLLERAFISGVRQASEAVYREAGVGQDQYNVTGSSPLGQMEEVEFIFQTVTWTYVIDGRTYTEGRVL